MTYVPLLREDYRGTSPISRRVCTPKVWKLLNLRTISGVNSFDNGPFRGGLPDANEKPILVRFVSSQANSNSPHFEQSFSEDGKTWEVNWITGQTRVNARPAKAP